jgi:penicillin-binding protein 2
MIEDIYKVAESFYLGKQTPFKIMNENPGIIKKTYIENERYYLAVGQSDDLLVTPVQMLYMISVIAKRGKFLGFNSNLESNILQCLYDGLLLSIKEGTSKEANLIKYEIAGKTGTASKKIGKKTNSWFVGFAPFNNPEIAIVIFLKYGRGSIDASPIAKKIFNSYFNIYHSDNF